MRSEGDQWNITTSVGATALGVAAARAVESRRAGALVNDPYAQAFVDTAGVDVALPGTSSASVETDRAWEGMATYLGVRSRFFDEFLGAAVAAGTRQVVLLAAGLDTRAFRLPWPDGVTVFEVDRPAVLEYKDQVLGQQSATPSARRVTVAADLREDWPAALRAAGFDPARPAAWIAEGLLPYLPAEAESELFERIEELSVAGSRIAVEYSTAGSADLGRPDMGVFTRLFGVDVAELTYLDGRGSVPEEQLSSLGWKNLSASPVDLAVTYQRRLPDEMRPVMGRSRLLEGERLAS